MATSSSWTSTLSGAWIQAATALHGTDTITISAPLGTATASGFSPTETGSQALLLGTATAAGFAPSLTETQTAPLGTAVASGSNPFVGENPTVSSWTSSSPGNWVAGGAAMHGANVVLVSLPVGLATATGSVQVRITQNLGPFIFPDPLLFPSPDLFPGMPNAVASGFSPTVKLIENLPAGRASANGFLDLGIGKATASGFGPQIQLTLFTGPDNPDEYADTSYSGDAPVLFSNATANGFSGLVDRGVAVPLGHALASGYSPVISVREAAEGQATATGRTPTPTVTVLVPLGHANATGGGGDFEFIPTGQATAVGFVPIVVVVRVTPRDAVVITGHIPVIPVEIVGHVPVEPVIVTRQPTLVPA